MKIYVGHSRSFDFENELYSVLRSSELNSECELILPHELDDNVKSKDIIEECNLFLAEASYPSIGLGIELGWADNFGIPIVCIHKKGSKISGSLKYLSDVFLEYKNGDELVDKIKSFLEDNYGH